MKEKKHPIANKIFPDYLTRLQFLFYTSIAAIFLGLVGGLGLHPYVEEQKAEKFQKKVYTLIKDAGVHRPVLKANGKPRKPTANQRMWMSMKALKRFSYYDVSITAEVPKGNARSYLKALHRAEYLDLCKQHTHVSAQQYLFKASNDTGPKAPQIRRDKSVYDQNLHKVVWPKGGAA